MFEYFVRDGETEVHETAELQSRDFNVKSGVFRSLNDTWVESTVVYRSLFVIILALLKIIGEFFSY